MSLSFDDKVTELLSCWFAVRIEVRWRAHVADISYFPFLDWSIPLPFFPLLSREPAITETLIFFGIGCVSVDSLSSAVFWATKFREFPPIVLDRKLDLSPFDRAIEVLANSLSYTFPRGTEGNLDDFRELSIIKLSLVVSLVSVTSPPPRGEFCNLTACRAIGFL